jgi:tetratricopeptide (TPR) repeat protein
MDISHVSARHRSFPIAGVAIGVAAFVAVSWIYLGRGRDQNSASAGVANTINQETAKLNVKRRTIELTSEKATRVRNAIKHADYSTTNSIAAEVLANSHLQNWRFYPFSDFIQGITDVSDPAFEAHLNEWVAQNKSDAIPLLVRAQYYYALGWFKRGDHFVKDTQADDLAAFKDYMTKALADVDAAIRLNDRNPFGYYLKLRVLHGSGPSEKFKSAFDEAIAKYPDYYSLYDIALGTLDPRWGGTIGEMYAFVDQYAGHAAQFSSLKLLYLSLYRDLLNFASVVCPSNGRDTDQLAQCVASVMQRIVKPRLEDQVVTALQLYDHSDNYQFGVVVEPILFDMLKAAGGDVYSGTILQLAATAMHSDTQLKEDKPGGNNYVIDKAVSESWYLKGFYDNALRKDQEALDDVVAAAFPSDEEKDLAVAGIYENIGGDYNKLNQYADMIAYEKAAIALGNDTEDQHFICYGYYRLKAYNDAVRECTKTIDDQPANVQARYWRGVAYRDSDQPDAALRDLTAVADSESDYRTDAAIDISMIYFNRDDNRSALGVLNKYRYLYDPNTNSRDGMAVSYNNRCYAFMQLGELKEALDDCTASLKYGSIPDAFRKQQELIRRLNAHEVGL